MKTDARQSSSIPAVGQAIAAALPAVLAALGASSTAQAAHDDGVVRTVGAGFGGVFRALDLLVAAPALLVPIGTRAVRAGLASAFVTALCGAILFDLARGLLETVVPAMLERVRLRGREERGLSPGLITAVATASVLTALLSPAWQSEACAPGGAVTGVLLVLAALRLALAGGAPAPLAFVLGLAGSYEPLVLLTAVAAVLPFATARASRPDLQTVCAFTLGLLPLGVGLATLHRPPEIALHVPIARLVDVAGRRTPLSAFALAELGVPLLLASAAGGVLAIATPAARRLGLALAGIAGAGAVAIGASAAAGPNRFSAAVLAAIAAAFVLGAVVLGALVLAVARTRLPFAEHSAALVVVLELVLPVKSIDETTTRREARNPNAAAIWNDVAWGAAPPGAVILVSDRSTLARVASARAAGALRGDLVLVPSFDVQGRQGQHALLAEPRLAPLYRDVALGLPPEELSLSQLGAQRPVLATFDPKWDRSLSRHLVPLGLTSRFEPEPRGLAERRQALETFTAVKDRLVGICVARKDPELAEATAVLLRARAVGMAATGERDVLARALDDLRSFAPDDGVGSALVRRTVTTKGPIDVRDLVL